MADTDVQESVKKKNFARNVLAKLMSLFTAKEKWQITVLFIFSLLTAVMQSTGVFSMMPFIDMVMNLESIHDNKYLEMAYQLFKFENINNFVVFIGSLVIVLLVLSSVMSSITIWLKNKFVLNINYSLSHRLMGKYLHKPYEYFLQSNSSELGMNILGNVNNLGNTFLSSIIDLVINIFMTLTLVATLLFVNTKITVVMFVFFGLTYGGLTYFIRTTLMKSGQLVNQFNKQRHQAAYEALNSIKITKALNLEEHFLNRYKKAARKYSNYQSFAKLISEIPSFVMEGMVFSSIIIAIIVLILRGHEIDSFIPTVSLFAFAGYRLLPAISRIFKDIITIIHNEPILDKVYNDMHDLGVRDIQPQQKEEKASQKLVAEQPVKTFSFDQGISLNNINFNYMDSKIIIDDLSLNIPKNSIVGFAGTTGAGKTTLIDIFLGLLLPKSGEFKIDDTVIDESNVQSWRKLVGYVPQDIFLIDDTIQSNIAFGVAEKEIDADRVKKVAQIAAISDFIENQLENGYMTIVGERGVRLSGGQRQRIGLARALYRNPSVLILDEATSALDGTTEELVLKGIHEQSSVRTMLIIAHRLNTLKVCDNIFLLDSGKILDQGTYDQLIQTNPQFMKMAKVE